jgi:hypothetical protein
VIYGIEISELASAGTSQPPQRADRSPNARNLSSVAGIVGTIFLHALAVSSVIIGEGAHKLHRQDPEGAGALRAASPVVPAEALVLIALADHAKPDADPLGGAALGFRVEEIRVPVMAPPPSSMSVETADDSPVDAPEITANAGDPAERALMYGRYTGQISARIERAWMRPRSPVTPPGSRVGSDGAKTTSDEDQRFRCEVQIRQDARGNVQEVLLLACNGTEKWRHSLIVAINQASPLPAPPIPTVFSRALNLAFEAHAYVPEDPPDEYEPPARDVVSSTLAVRSSGQSFDAPNGPIRGSPDDDRESPNR